MPTVVVAAGGDRDLELGADAVGGGDEDRVAVARRLEVEERAEAAEPRRRSRARRRACQRLQPLDERVAGIDIDAGPAIAVAVRGLHDAVLGHGGGGEKAGGAG